MLYPDQITKALRSVFVLTFCLCCLAVQPAWAASPSHGDKEGGTAEFEYMELPPLTLPIITHEGVTQQVMLVVSIELPYGAMEEMEPFKPRLADAYLMDLYGVLGAGHALMKGHVIDVKVVKERLMIVTDRILGHGKFSDVLLQVVQQRSM